MKKDKKPPGFNRLIFTDMYHPLDHWIGTQRCFEHGPGGWRSLLQHVEYSWEWGWGRSILHRLNLHIFCRMGWHEWSVMYLYPEGLSKGDPERSIACRWCGKNIEEEVSIDE